MKQSEKYKIIFQTKPGLPFRTALGIAIDFVLKHNMCVTFYFNNEQYELDPDKIKLQYREYILDRFSKENPISHSI